MLRHVEVNRCLRLNCADQRQGLSLAFKHWERSLRLFKVISQHCRIHGAVHVCWTKTVLAVNVTDFDFLSINSSSRYCNLSEQSSHGVCKTWKCKFLQLGQAKQFEKIKAKLIIENLTRFLRYYIKLYLAIISFEAHRLNFRNSCLRIIHRVTVSMLCVNLFFSCLYLCSHLCQIKLQTSLILSKWVSESVL